MKISIWLWLVTLLSVVVSALAVFQIHSENRVLEARADHFISAQQAFARRDYRTAIDASRAYFALDPRNPNLANEEEAIETYDLAVTRWLAKNLQEDAPRVQTTVSEFQKVLKTVKALARSEPPGS